jgi:hypothetical protein
LLQMFASLLVVLLQRAVVDGFGWFGGVQCHSVLSWLVAYCECAGFGSPAALSCVQAMPKSVRRDTLSQGLTALLFQA